ncbi:MAG: class I SAM-dependent methyltransferase, partial [Enterococcus sp.]|uniref:class I SAM-dependent methyltransferase n=1 Tax=Enterococcus sp. TaxID=35783 RepID=UPI00399294E2
HTSVGKIISQITEGSSVLEFGPGNGRMTQYLINEKKCRVSIVEFDSVLFEHVMGFAQDGFLGNIEEYKWNDHFTDKKFDFIVFADVLEHLTDSEKALKEASKFLAPNGEVLLTFPNLAHNSVLIDLFNNKLDWKQYGLLDRTHNSFYTQRGLKNYLIESVYQFVVKILPIRRLVKMSYQQATKSCQKWFAMISKTVHSAKSISISMLYVKSLLKI